MSDELMSDDDRIQAIFEAARELFPAIASGRPKAAERALSDAIDSFGYHRYAEGRADERREWQEQAMEKACRAMNETGQGEHGGLVKSIEEIWNLAPRRAA